jgi:hypothetical protein
MVLFWVLIAGWDRTGWKTLIDFIQSSYQDTSNYKVYGKHLNRLNFENIIKFEFHVPKLT